MELLPIFLVAFYLSVWILLAPTSERTQMEYLAQLVINDFLYRSQSLLFRFFSRTFLQPLVSNIGSLLIRVIPRKATIVMWRTLFESVLDIIALIVMFQDNEFIYQPSGFD